MNDYLGDVTQSTTCFADEVKPVSFDDILEGINKLELVKKPHIVKIEVNKKDAKVFAKLPTVFKDDNRKQLLTGVIGTLYGIPFKVRPYIKKSRIWVKK